jgi:hypothetical protein
MAGLDPAIQAHWSEAKRHDDSRMNEGAKAALAVISGVRAWMAGSSPAMTDAGARARAGAASRSMEKSHGA